MGRVQDDPHAYFVRCEDVVADAIWAAVEKRQHNLENWNIFEGEKA